MTLDTLFFPIDPGKVNALAWMSKACDIFISKGFVWGDFFYRGGSADDSLYKYELVNFKVRLGFPLLAKILLGTGVLLVLGLALGMRQANRRWKNTA